VTSSHFVWFTYNDYKKRKGEIADWKEIKIPRTNIQEIKRRQIQIRATKLSVLPPMHSYTDYFPFLFSF
jgi:hypothetical protein